MTGQAGSGRTVIELDFGITVYPARFEGDRWRAVWHENGERQQCESVKEASAGRQAGEGHRAAGSRRPEHEAARSGPDRLLSPP